MLDLFLVVDQELHEEQLRPLDVEGRDEAEGSEIDGTRLRQLCGRRGALWLAALVRRREDASVLLTGGLVIEEDFP